MNYIIKRHKNPITNYNICVMFLLMFLVVLGISDSILNIDIMDKNLAVVISTLAVVVYLGAVLSSLQYYNLKKDKYIIYYLVYFVFAFFTYFMNQINLFNVKYEDMWFYLCFVNKVLILISIIPEIKLKKEKLNKKYIFKMCFLFICLILCILEVIYSKIPYNNEILGILFFAANLIYIYGAIINFKKYISEKNYLCMILCVFLIVNFVKNYYIVIYYNTGFEIKKYATLAVLIMFMNIVMYIIGVLFIVNMDYNYELRDIQDWDAFYDIFDNEFEDKEIYFIRDDWNIIYANKAARKKHGIEDSNIDSFRQLCKKCRKSVDNIGSEYYSKIKTCVDKNNEWSGLVTWGDNEEALVDVKIKQSKDYGRISVVQVNYNKEIIKLKKTIKEKNEIFKNITEKSGDLIVIIDTDKNITYANDEVYRILGYSKDEIIGHKVTDFLEEKNSYRIDENIIFDEAHAICKDKKIIDFETLGTRINDEGWMLVSRNITIRRELKLLKAEYEEIKSHQQIKNEFFANLSHELKTPLNIFYSTIQILDLNLNKSDNEFRLAYERYNDVLRMNFYRMHRMITNLIDLTKFNSNFEKVKLDNYDIVKLCEDVSLSVVNYANQKNINIIFDTEKEEHIIKCDAEYIERIMLNLLSNGIKYTHSNGEIFVDLTFSEEYVCIKVKDNGIGIPKEKLDSVFEKFVRVDKSLRRENEGSGIGLSIVKSLVDLLGGNIYIKSEENVGSEFVVMLPNETLDGKVKDYLIDEQNVNLELSDIYN